MGRAECKQEGDSACLGRHWSPGRGGGDDEEVELRCEWPRASDAAIVALSRCVCFPEHASGRSRLACVGVFAHARRPDAKPVEVLFEGCVAHLVRSSAIALATGGACVQNWALGFGGRM